MIVAGEPATVLDALFYYTLHIHTAIIIAVAGSVVSVINEVVHPYFPVS